MQEFRASKAVALPWLSRGFNNREFDYGIDAATNTFSISFAGYPFNIIYSYDSATHKWVTKNMEFL